MARPSLYTEELAATICAQIAEGQSLTGVSKSVGMPSVRTIQAWFLKYPAFREAYEIAFRAHEQVVFDNLTEIASDGSKDWVTNAGGFRVVDHEHIARSKLRVDTVKWQLARMNPQRFGDKQTVENTGQITHNHVVEGVTNLDRAKALAALLAATGRQIAPANSIIISLPDTLTPEEAQALRERFLGMAAVLGVPQEAAAPVRPSPIDRLKEITLRPIDPQPKGFEDDNY